MNENIDLTKILKDCPRGWKFYSSVYGEVEFLGILYDYVSLNELENTRNFPNIQKQRYPIQLMTDSGEYCISRRGRYRYGVGECTLFPSKEQRDWSKFTAPWYKKDKLVKTKFKVGDWVVRGDTVAQILDIQEQYYVGLDINGKDFVSSRFLDDDKIHFWTIQDVKDGDVLVNGSNIFIFHFINNRRLMGYCHVNMDDGNFYNDIGRNECFCTIDAPVTPATKEQRDLLFQKIKEADYKWNAKTKTLEKLSEPKFDPKTLNLFDKVLVKMSNESFNTWYGDFVAEPSHAKNETPLILGAKEANMVIPYNDDTKHLIGTTDEAPEYYRYWED